MRYGVVRTTELVSSNKSSIHPIATSHLYKAAFQERFFDVGTDDVTNYLIVPKGNYYKTYIIL